METIAFNDRASVQLAWEDYNKKKLTADEFATIVATAFQLTLPEKKEREHTPVEEKDASIERSRKRKEREQSKRWVKIERHNLERRTASLLAEEHDLKFIYVRPPLGDKHMRGGLTITYQEANGKRSVLASVSYCSRKDAFCKATGRYYAADKFDWGDSLEIMIPRGYRVEQVLRDMFGALLSYEV